MPELIRLECVDSTNTFLKKLAQEGAADGTVVIASRQSGGRGRTGNSFSSEEGGLYLSMLMRTEHLALADVTGITSKTAVETVRALFGAYGICAEVKWVNDIILNQKKLGGILVEAGRLSAGGQIPWVIVGVGINVNQRDFPEEIRNKASSLLMETGFPWETDALMIALIDRLNFLRENLASPEEAAAYLEEYRGICATIGRELTFVRDGALKSCRALGVDDSYGLIVQYPDSAVEVLRSGEISVRGIAGYV